MAVSVRSPVEPMLALWSHEVDVLGLVVGFERGEVHVEGRPARVDVRATSLYRREGGGWRVVGHRTDPLG
ncbi:MAG TPA: hypothetical protein VFT70_08105 [Nocardioides sp.]|nr:hypothetical protein [Nocardioides sp.]